MFSAVTTSRAGRIGSALIAAAAIGAAFALHASHRRDAAFLALAGFLLGLLLQRTRFCSNGAFRGDPQAARTFLIALAAGAAGFAVVFEMQMPDASGPWRPQHWFVAGAGWHLALGGALFGAGMAVAGSCFGSGLVRLGEGRLEPWFLLPGALAGTALGYLCWNWFWSNVVSSARPIWLPSFLGYGGAVALTLAACVGLGLVLTRRREPGPAPVAPWVGGLLLGGLATMIFQRTAPWGVTGELHRLTRAAAAPILPARLEGLDQMRGCSPGLVQAGLSDNAVLVLSIVAGAFAAAMLAGEFRPRRAPAAACARSFAGGVLMGFGALISWGCTIGTFLSGAMSLSVHAWIFAAGCFAGAWSVRRIAARAA